MLTHSEKENLLSNFPNIKLSYENITHKKVYNYDYIVAIPYGKKCFAWFTTLNDKTVCLIMELTNNKKINDIKIYNACFSNELAYGTILYGTVIYNSQNKFFLIEDIFSYKGNVIDNENWGEKLIKINDMLKKELKQKSYNNSFIVFGLPLMCKSNEELETKLTSIKYDIDIIQFKNFNNINNFLVKYYKDYIESKVIIEKRKETPRKETPRKETPRKEIVEKANVNNAISREKEIVFLVRPDIQNDIYYLYCLNNELKEEQYCIAHIPNYDVSVMMNKLFRVIKENTNLDALEESDDEEEFENENIDKFVYLDKSYKMVCKYNYKFKKWVPIKLAREENTIVSLHQLKNMCKFHEQNRKR